MQAETKIDLYTFLNRADYLYTRVMKNSSQHNRSAEGAAEFLDISHSVIGMNRIPIQHGILVSNVHTSTKEFLTICNRM